MPINIRKAVSRDLDAIAEIYEHIHTKIESGQAAVGWIRGVYPTRATAEAALDRGDLFVEELDGTVVAAAILNQTQVDIYADAPWQYDAPDEQVMVLHTLVVDPLVEVRGLGTAFVNYYEQYAREHGCPYLRIDTNALNINARRFYKKLHFNEIAILPCDFNGIPGIQLVLLEKKLS